MNDTPSSTSTQVNDMEQTQGVPADELEAENSVAMAWNTVRAEARALTAHRLAQSGGLSDLLAAVEEYGDRRAAQAMLSAAPQAQPVAEGHDPSTWSQYVAGVIGCYLGLDDDKDSAKLAGIAGIIERRRWAQPVEAERAPAEAHDRKAQALALCHALEEQPGSQYQTAAVLAAFKVYRAFESIEKHGEIRQWVFDVAAPCAQALTQPAQPAQPVEAEQAAAPAPEVAYFDGCLMVGYSKDRDDYCVYEETAPGEYCAIKGPFKTKEEADSALRDPNAPTIFQASPAQAQPVEAEQAAAEGDTTVRESDRQLMAFYSVESLRELIDAQEEHIRRLQSKAIPIDQLALIRVREG